jgi:hypothetical protein
MLLFLTTNTFPNPIGESPKFMTHTLALKIGRNGNFNPLHLGEILRNKIFQLKLTKQSQNLFSPEIHCEHTVIM